MKRFIHFIDTLYDKVPGVFENYEQEGGEYFQSEEEEEDSDEESDDASTEEDDCDDVFAWLSLLAIHSFDDIYLWSISMTYHIDII